jgi:hypothetical protein
MKTRSPAPTGPDRAAWAAVAVAAVCLALRKPWALLTPQLWAEDGSIFLVQDEQLGLGAWLTPYNGYLHLLPRIVAWGTSRTLDVAWWPAAYNGAAYLVPLALFARLASRRVDLPAKPALILAFSLVVGTGEVLIVLTNLQWLAAFFLLLQVFTRPPRNQWERAGDLTLLAVVGLNGPFAAVFGPLLAWKWWGTRNRDDLAALAVTGAAAVTQGLLLLQTPLDINAEAAPFRPLMALSVIGSRLVTWPFLGPDAVRVAAPWVHAVAGALFLSAVAGWALRPEALRPIRLRLVVALAIVTAACAFRARADIWAEDTLVNGDRYYYIPRVLVAWLVVLEWRAQPAAVAWAARTLVAAGILLHLPHFILPAPPDYRWAEHCDAIRRGVPANIHTLPEGWWIEYPGRPQRTSPP